MSAWQPLASELDRWSALGRTATLWCRDDDACRDSPALRRLLECARSREVPVAIAAIPALCEPSLAAAIARYDVATVIQHGYAHRNHAPAGERSCELGSHRPLAACIDELGTGRETLEAAFGARFLPALVPPWNRIATDVVTALPRAGLSALSTFAPRPHATAAPGVGQCNTHVDVIAWRHGRTFVGAARAVSLLVEHLSARRLGAVDADEPTGLLTHHLELSDEAWQFVDELFARMRAHAAARWLRAGDVFAQASVAAQRVRSGRSA
jgi:hypothetical protein